MTSTDLLDAPNPTPAPTPTTPEGSLLAGVEKQAVPETQPKGDTTPPVAAKEPEKAPEKPPVPDKYELKDSEGKPFASDSFNAVAKKLGLTNDAAQEVFATLAPALQEQQVAKMQAERDTVAQQWATETTGNREFGGDKLAANIAAVNRALDEVPGGVQVRELLQQSGYGNKLEVLQFLAAFGKAISPDNKVVTGEPEGAPPLTPIQKLGAGYERNRIAQKG